jgi:GNAT superfamily N-acetyltransferase
VIDRFTAMKKYVVRPADARDIEAVYYVVAKQKTFDFGSAMMSMDNWQRKWGNLNLENDTLTAFADGKLAGYAELLDGDSPFIYLEDRGNVDLAYQLLMLLEQKAARRAKGSVERATQVSERNQLLLQLYASSGYRSNLSFLIMELRLDEPPALPQWAEAIHARAFVPGQDEQITYEVDEEAAKDKGYHSPLDYEGWVKRMGMDRESFDSGIWFLACEKEKVVGVVLNAHDKEPNTVWVDHLSVKREWRKKGIGKALLLYSFGEFYKRGLHVVKLSVDSKSLTNAPRLYESVGMMTVQQYHIYKKNLLV